MQPNPSLLLVALAAASLAPGAAARSDCGWTTASPAPQARVEAPAAVIGGRLYVFGGFADAALHTSQRVDVYDPATDAWTGAADLPVAITHAGVAVDGTTVWFAGGFQGNHPGFAVADVRRYDAPSDTWSAGPPLPEPRAGGALVRLGTRLHYFGGVLADRNTDSGAHWELDLASPTGWIPRAPLPSPRNHLAGAEVGGRVYAIGGQHNHDTSPFDVADVHAWDPASDAWSAVASLPAARSHFEPGTSVVAGRIRIAGGRGPLASDLAVLAVTEYDPLADAWSDVFSLPQALFAPAAHPIGAEYVVACGGPSVNQPGTATWRRPLDPTAPADVRRIDCGAGGGSIQSGVAWCPDEGFIGGGAYANPAVGDVANTADDALYRTERSGAPPDVARFAYSLAASPGWHRVVLRFAEIYWGAPNGGPGGVGRRVFDVRLEGATVLDDFDPTAEAGGALAAVERTFELAVGDGSIDLELEASVDQPTIGAIELIELSAGSVASYCTTSPNSVGPGATIGWQGSTSLSLQGAGLTVAGGPPGKSGLFFFGSQPDQTPFGDGVRCVAGQVFRLATVVLDPNGAAASALDFTSPPATVIAPGSTWYFQMRYRDPFGPLGSGFNYTDAVAATFWP